MQALQVWDLVLQNESVLDRADSKVYILVLPGVIGPVSSIGPGDVAFKESPPSPTLTCLTACFPSHYSLLCKGLGLLIQRGPFHHPSVEG